MATSEQIITADPERIRAWAQERGGEPMRMRGVVRRENVVMTGE